MAEMDRKTAEAPLSPLALLADAVGGDDRIKSCGRELSKTGRDGNGSRKTEEICLQPSQTSRQAEGGNEAIYSKSHISLGAEGKNQVDRP